MSFLNYAKTGLFWKRVLIISVLFLTAIIVVSLLFNSFKAIINFDLEAIKSQNFSEGKWKRFFLPKVVISLLYGIWVTYRNTKIKEGRV